MALLSIADYIDHIADLVGQKDDTNTEARVLRWLSDAEQELWEKEPWWFRQAEDTVAVMSGTIEYTFGQQTQYLYQVIVDAGEPLAYMDPGDFRELCQSNPVAGTPAFWSQLVNTSGDFTKFGIWPTATGTAKVVYDKKARTNLANDAASYSQFPLDNRLVVLKRAVIEAAKHHSMTQELPGFVKDFEETYGRLVAQNNAHPRYVRR